jgi:sugar phosphate isomerase/epimerase
MKLSIAVQTPEVNRILPVALASGTLVEKLEKAARWGADGIEFMTVDPRTLDWAEIKSLLVANGLEASAVASGGMAFALGVTLLNDDPAIMELARTRLFDMIDMAAALDASVVTIGSFRGRKATFSGNASQRLADILFKAGEYAHPKNIRLALEAINRFENDFIANAGEGLNFIRRISHPAVGLLLDTFHMNIEESSWTVPFVDAMAEKKLFHVHLGDNNRLPPGEGMIDFPAIVHNLMDLEYTGYLSAELLAIPDPDTAARQTLEYMNRILQAHREII